VAISSVQAFPAGLLDILGLKGRGSWPGLLADQYVGTLPMLQMLAKSRLTTVTATNAAAGQGGIAQVVVPPNQHWLVQGADARGGGQAAMTNFGVAVLVATSIPGSAMPVAYDRFIPPLIVANYDVPWAPAIPWLLQPGDSLVAVVRELAGVANTSITIQAQVGVFGG
jgi:hypothetical protein